MIKSTGKNGAGGSCWFTSIVLFFGAMVGFSLARISIQSHTNSFKETIQPTHNVDEMHGKSTQRLTELTNLLKESKSLISSLKDILKMERENSGGGVRGTETSSLCESENSTLLSKLSTAENDRAKLQTKLIKAEATAAIATTMEQQTP